MAAGTPHLGRACGARTAGRAPRCFARRARRDCLPRCPAGTHADEASASRAFAFRRLPRTMAFVNAVAWIAHREDHHPDLSVRYNRVDVVVFDARRRRRHAQRLHLRGEDRIACREPVIAATASDAVAPQGVIGAAGLVIAAHPAALPASRSTTAARSGMRAARTHAVARLRRSRTLVASGPRDGVIEAVLPRTTLFYPLRRTGAKS